MFASEEPFTCGGSRAGMITPAAQSPPRGCPTLERCSTTIPPQTVASSWAVSSVSPTTTASPRTRTVMTGAGGSRLTADAGYDIRLVSNVSLTPRLTYCYGRISHVNTGALGSFFTGWKQNVIDLGLGLTVR